MPETSPDIPSVWITGSALRAAALGMLLGSLGACATTATQSSDLRVPYGEASGVVKAAAAPGLSMANIERYLHAKSGNLKAARPGVWRLSVDGVLVLMVCEDSRIRILAPIFALNQLEGEPALAHALMLRLLQSNFERSIDARYAVFDGIVFATSTHPRATLHEEDLDRFLTQVVNLHKNTFRNGTTGYSSATPEPGSVEIDPRLDESLRSPETFEDRGQAAPKPASKEKKKGLLL